jgi:hypothetical protein
MARKNDATEKVIYNKARENMARAARRLARKAQVKYRADLETELRKLAIESAKELQVARKSFQQEPEDEEDPESNDIAANDDSFVNSLLAANMDILNEFHVIGGTGDVEPKGPDSASSVKSADRDNALPKIPEQLIQQDMYPESDDGKNWMRDNDDSEDEGHGGARLDGPNLLGGEVEPETLGSGGSIVSKVALRTPAASSTSRKRKFSNAHVTFMRDIQWAKMHFISSEERLGQTF